MSRAYLALIWGVPPRARGTIDAALARSKTKRTKIAVARDGRGRRAVTHYAVEQTFKDTGGKPVASLVRIRLETGRTHQIRVHFAYLGHPLLGDRTYGAGFAASARRLSAEAQSALAKLGRQALHAVQLSFVHPDTGKRLTFDSPPPPDLARLISSLQLKRG
jgi:23S rRNA pseudouridine1911/1915/1917 synthase